MENKEILQVLRSIDRKLGVLAGDIVKRSASSVHERVRELSRLKMSNPEIAEILGISTTHVAKEKSVGKKKKGSKK